MTDLNVHKKISRDEMIEKLGLETLSKTDQIRIVQELDNVIMSKTQLAILEVLPEFERLQFMQHINTGNTILASRFLKENIPNLRDLVGEVAERTIKEFMRIRELKA